MTVGGIAGGVGTIIAGEQQVGMLHANADAARRDANMAHAAGQAQARDIEREAVFFKGAQRAASAAQGFLPDEGTGLAFLEETERESKRAQLRTIYAAEVDVARFLFEKNIYNQQAINTRIIAGISAVSQAAGGGGAQAPTLVQRAPSHARSFRVEPAFQKFRAGERADLSGGGYAPGGNLGTSGQPATEDWDWSW